MSGSYKLIVHPSQFLISATWPIERFLDGPCYKNDHSTFQITRTLFRTYVGLAAPRMHPNVNALLLTEPVWKFWRVHESEFLETFWKHVTELWRNCDEPLNGLFGLEICCNWCSVVVGSAGRLYRSSRSVKKPPGSWNEQNEQKWTFFQKLLNRSKNGWDRLVLILEASPRNLVDVSRS